MAVDGFAPVLDQADGPVVNLPQLRRLRVCLLGGDSCLSTVGKADLASALLRGLTADQPGTSDPVLDLAFDYGVFERAWRELLVTPQDGDDFDRWGAGPLGSWHDAGRVHFEPPLAGRGKCTPPFDADPAVECAALCSGNAEKLNFGHKRAPGICRAFREALSAAGQDVEAIERVHQSLQAAAEINPRQLVRKDQPCPGLLATFARFSPEVGSFAGCGVVFLHIFELGYRPFGSPQNVGMLYGAAPNSKMHEHISPGSALCALRAAGSNIARVVREYNRVASDQAAPGWERSLWFQADLRAQVECLLSDKNLRTDIHLWQKIACDADGWLDLEHVKGSHKEEKGLLDAKLLDALSTSKCVETKVTEDGTVFVRRAGGRALPQTDGVLLRSGKGAKRKRSSLGLDGTDDPSCWDYVRKGFCSRGDKCPYGHARPLPMMPSPVGAEVAGLELLPETEACWDFCNTGHCPRGERCRYVHTERSDATSVSDKVERIDSSPKIAASAKLTQDQDLVASCHQQPFARERGECSSFAKFEENEETVIRVVKRVRDSAAVVLACEPQVSDNGDAAAKQL